MPMKATMYEAHIAIAYRPQVTLGPTDTRDEAARLARAWLETYARSNEAERNPPGNIVIERVECE
jgi:hypothetical protein